jgi:His/Glu/Gln/Arg/opine family amino acid ABC transporter permease subunit
MLFDFSIISNNFVYISKGISLTLIITGLALVLGICLGLGICLAKLSHFRVLSYPASAYLEFFRNTPVLIQIIWLYYALPLFTGIEMNALTSCTIALGLNVAAYLADTFRAGIQWVDRGQIEAAYSLGFSYFQAMRKIILPQALKVVIPPFINRLVALLKATSLVSLLGVAELTYRATVIASRTYRCVEVYCFIAVVYLLILTGLSLLADHLDSKFASTM